MDAPEPRILFEDDDVIVVDKPAGLLSQGDHSGARSLVDFAREHLRKDHVGVLHRLDRNVSGVVMIAKHKEAAAYHSRAIAEDQVRRAYVAVSATRRERFQRLRTEPDFWIRERLTKDESKNHVRVDANGQSAESHVRLLEHAQGLAGTLVKLAIELHSGRSHQIRVHLAHAELPIVGDARYGVELSGISRPLLHARSIAFKDRKSGAERAFECEAPFALTDVVAARRRKNSRM